jgi:hypothetical protein
MPTPIQKGEKYTAAITVQGPKDRARFRRFRVALGKLVRKEKGRVVEKKVRPKRRRR